MNENENETQPPDDTAQGPSHDPPTSDPVDHLQDQLRRLRRSRSSKVLSGVCGGLSRSFGVDPLLLRVVTAVLVLFGGAGVLLYAAAWLLLPVDDGTPSVASQVLDRHRYRPGTETKLLAVVLAVVITSSAVGLLKVWHGPVLVGAAIVSVLLLLQRRTVPVLTSPIQDGYATAIPAAPSTTHPGVTAPLPAQVPAPYVAPPRHRSALFGLTFSVVVIGWGLLAAADALRFDPPVAAYPALGLALTGLGLLVGAWRGRARWLILWGLLLALLLAPAALVDQAAHVRGPSFSGTKKVDDVSELPQHARFESGQVEYDLSHLDLADGSGSMDVRMGFGEVVVVVPQDVDVTVQANASTGGLTVFGAQSGGLDTRVTRTDVGADGPGGGTLDITLYAGIGHLEVRRATS